jgi:hypothetical protein
MKKYLVGLMFSFIVCVNAFAATFIPPGEQTFLDDNGSPLAGGSVYFYIPNTTTLKNTWSDVNQTTLNTNPVVLDAGGRAIIYGNGAYRQIVKDSDGNTIWDRYTSDSSSSTSSWGGTSTGSANAQVVSAPNFSSEAGQSISFIAGFTNNAATSLNAGGGPINILKDTTAGPTGLTGGEIVVGNQYTVIYDTVVGQFHLVSLPQQPFIGTASNISSASTTNIGTIGSHNANIVGTTTINSFGSSASASNPVYLVQFAGALTITAGVNIITPDGANLNTVAGASAILFYKGAGIWQILSYSGGSVPTGMVAMFNLANCPSGWSYANGSGGLADLRGRYARGYDNGAGINVGPVVGALQSDQLGDHAHQTESKTAIYSGGGVAFDAFFIGGGAGPGSNYPTSNPITGNHGPETRPYTTVLLPCQKL